MNDSTTGLELFSYDGEGRVEGQEELFWPNLTE